MKQAGIVNLYCTVCCGQFINKVLTFQHSSKKTAGQDWTNGWKVYLKPLCWRRRKIMVHLKEKVEENDVELVRIYGYCIGRAIHARFKQSK